MRPVSIVRFEQAYLASVLVWLVNLALGWNTRIDAMGKNPAFGGNPQMLEMAGTIMIAMSAVMLIVSLALWYFTARSASEAAKWIVTVFFGITVLGLPFALMSYKTLGVLSMVLTLIGFALNTYAVWMLFRPDANAWFKGVPVVPLADPVE